ncbi:UPF0481 protein At3g47200-like [Argentina anserina]|uniref:UPF0481 protein At3g47200-like n=1 Tax=Argentina anserina TaxID=57926 RepID=UPI0021762E8E|nr:UPF0481 protein At3g47200-like [Potentilla anserina]
MEINDGSGRQHTVIYVDDGKQCIFRVPKVLQKQNPDAYTPYVVSIGPFHHRRKVSKNEATDHQEEDKEDKGKEYQLVERMKERYLNEVLSCTGITTLKELTAKVIEISDQKNDGPFQFEKDARDFYAEPLDYEPQYFNEMMVFDGCFLIQLFRKCSDVQLRGGYDPLFNMDCMFHFLCHDLLLLENQLPWFVLETIYSLILANSHSRPSHPLSILILDAFKHLPSLKHCDSYRNHLLHRHPHKKNWRGRVDYADVLHILDLMRDSVVVPIMMTEQTEKKPVQAILDPDVHEMHTATALSKAGISFRGFKAETSIMDIQFEEGWLICNGVLNIPQLNVGMLSESLFRNLIAFEQCYSGISNEITSYAVFMDNLISTQQDMELLCKEKVIGNWLSDEEGCKFFNNLYKGIPHTKFYYGPLCEKVQRRYEMNWYTYVASFKTQKLSNPWAVLGFCTAIILLALQLWNSTNSLRTFRKANNGF